MATLIDVKPKLNQQNDRRIRFDISMPLTAKVLASSPQDVQDAFYAVAKDGAHLNPIGISAEYEGVVMSIFDTPQTKAARLELENCTLKQLEVCRPENKLNLDDGDVRLSFHMNVPASKDSWLWGFSCYGSDFTALFEEMQPIFPQIKAADPDGDGQGILNMERQETQSTIAQPEPKLSARERAEKVLGGKGDMPTQGKEQKRAASKIKTAKKAKK